MIVIVFLGLALLSGGIPSAINAAADIQKDYIGVLCDSYYRYTEICDNLK